MTTTPLWDWLQAKLDPAQYPPEAAEGVVAQRLTGREGEYYVLKNPASKTYYRLGDRDFFLWQRMDGTQTVKDLVVAYFMQFGSFAFARVLSLVEGLKANLFLTDRPVNVYRQVRERLARRSPSYRLNQITEIFMEKQVAIHGIDGALGAIYRTVGRILFTRPLQIAYLLISISGLYLFFRAFQAGDWSAVTINGSYTWGVIGLLVGELVSIFAHEMSHALTVKHYGREVRRGGVMLYFGTPAFFVDTTDIWLENKRARLAVTWAGPYSGLILGGLASAAITLRPHWELSALLFQFALVSYVLVFFNLNPLLELDGYYLLMDALEIPMLRDKSFEFVRSGLWAKLRSSGRKVRQVLASFSREEKIFAVFGLLSAAWTLYAIYSGLDFWRLQVAEVVGSLWAGGGVGQIVLGLLGLAIAVPLVMGVGNLLFGIGHRALTWADGQGFFDRTWNVAALLLLLTAALALAPRYLSYLIPPTRGDTAGLIGLLALAVGAFLAWRNAANYAGSRLARPFGLLGLFLLLLLLKDAAALATEWPLLSADVLRSLLSALALLALALLLPTLLAFWRTNSGPAWAMLLLALGGLVLATWLGLSPLVPYLLLASSLLFHYVVYARIQYHTEEVEADSEMPDHLRLQRTFAWTAGRVLSQLREIAGERNSRALEERFNRYALAAGWKLSLARQSRKGGTEYLEVSDALPADLDVIERGQVYAAALNALLDQVAREVGEKLAVRALQRTYDRLPWQEREIGGQYLFRDVERATALSQQFQATRQDYGGLLRRMPLLATMEGAELELLCSRLRAEHFPAGRAIIRQGDQGDKFYIIRQGHVEVTVRDEQGVTEVVGQLDRGDYLGELALLHDAPRSATCRATVPTDVLSLSRQDFDQLVKTRFALREKVDASITRVDLLRQMPLFAELDAQQLQWIAAAMKPEAFGAGTVLIRQGEIGETFYVIQAGRVQVTVDQDGEEKVIAERGPGEYLGEIALLLEVPRTATVTALTPLQVLTMHKRDFDRLVAEHLYVSRGLQRETSRRMLNLRRMTTVMEGT